MIDLLRVARIASAPFGGGDDLVGDVVLGLVECVSEVDPSFEEPQIARWLLTRARWLALGHLRKLKRLEARSGPLPVLEDGPSGQDPFSALALKRVLLRQAPGDLAIAHQEGPRGDMARHRLRAVLRKEGFL